MTWIIIIVIALVVAYVTLRVFLKMNGGGATLAQFELPEDSDKESFLDPKTGKRYDKEAYEAYLQRMVHSMTDQQLTSLIRQYGNRSDIWNEKMCEVIRLERAQRAEAVEQVAEEHEIEEDQINAEIAPFFWVEQSTGASVGLSCGEYMQELFESNGMAGTEKDWDRLAKAFVNDDADLRGKLQFDSQEDMFCVYSRDAQALEKFILAFRETCEDREKIQDLFNRVTLE